VKEREPGKVRVRWATESGAEMTFECERVDEAIAVAARRWFASNNSPDLMAMVVVVEREGKTMTDAEAEGKICDEFAMMRAASEARGVPWDRIQLVPPQKAPPGTICPECGGTQESPKLVRGPDEEIDVEPSHRCPHPWHKAKV
jgi:hypothetical protein